MSTATTHIKTDNQLVPALRFKEFEGGWSLTKVLDFAPLQRGFDLPVIEIKEGPYPVVFSNGISKTHSEYKAKAPGVVTGRSGTIGKVTFVEENYWPHNTSLWVTDFKGNDAKYVFYFYFNFKLERFGTGSGVPTLNRNDVHSEKRPIPQLPEQQKIASFLSAVDEKIQQLTKKKELLEQYKKGLMQQLFSGQLRFKDENGNPYPDWEEKALGEIGDIYQPKTISQTELTNEGYNVYGANGIIGKYHSFNHEKEQVAITCRGNTCGTVNFTLPLSWITGNAMVVNLDNSINANKRFIYYQLINTNLHYLITGSGQPQITGNVKKHKLIFPCLKEQQKIAIYLSRIDTKIEAVNNQITQTQTFKKGLLQQMFV